MNPPASIQSQLDSFGFPVALAVVGPKKTAYWGDTAKVYPAASVTKLVTAYAILIAVEHGHITLNAPAQCPELAADGVTLTHLLSHASGLSFDGAIARKKPGHRRIYSNIGIEEAAKTLEKTLGIPLNQWVEEQIVQPLKLEHLNMWGSAAYGMNINTNDLAELAKEFMNPTLISPSLMRAATTPINPMLDGVAPGYGTQKPNPWGLGFEIRGHKNPHWTAPRGTPDTYGHFGRAGSFLWIDPKTSTGAVFLGEKPYCQTHHNLWPALNQAIINDGALQSFITGKD